MKATLDEFETDLRLDAPRRGSLERQLEALKERLWTQMVASIENTSLLQELRWVANEAAALSWLTACPVLVLPTLLEEKIQTALRRWERQENIRERCKLREATPRMPFPTNRSAAPVSL